MKKIISFNVNGLRSAIAKGFKEWVAANDFDFICLQETKMDASHADPDYFKDLKYHSYWHCAEKKGYSGVLILAKEKADQVQFGTGKEIYDREGRLIVLDYPGFSLANCYFPSGSSGEDRHQFKMKFLEDLYPVFKSMNEQKTNFIVVGDYNIVHQGIDIHNPERTDNPSGYRPEERAWLDRWFKELFYDSFRLLNPDKKEYSWWSYRANARAKNLGWRIDYNMVTKNLEKNLKRSVILPEAMHSDHCPVLLEIDV